MAPRLVTGSWVPEMAYLNGHGPPYVQDLYLSLQLVSRIGIAVGRPWAFHPSLLDGWVHITFDDRKEEIGARSEKYEKRCF
jgi:hypothetical protein